MKTIGEKALNDSDIKIILEDFEKQYNSYEELQQKAVSFKCRKPDLVDDLMTWKALKNGAVLNKSIEIQDKDIFNNLSKKRVELLKLLNSRNYRSIRDLSNKAGRDYKNVYDDLIALEKFGLISFRRVGRRKIPVSQVERLIIEIE